MSEKYRDMFVQEAQEHIQNLNDSLLKLEKNLGDKKLLDSLFRSAHTVKGMASAMGYEQIAQLCAKMEDILDSKRKDKGTLSSLQITHFFTCVDILEQLVVDDSKRIDLEHYLNKLNNPETAEKSDKMEPLSTLQSSSIRVKMKDLDYLVNLVGELVISKMRIEETLRKTADHETRQAIATLERITTELQDNAMKLRLVSIDHIFSRFSRMVRDLSTNQGKEVTFKMESHGIEIDRGVLDAIIDPILHMLRNAVDHGIEKPHVRESLGKPRSAMLSLFCSRSGDKVVIQILDDGKGIDIERIRSVAIEKNIISKKEAEHLDDDGILDLLGTPGLSSSMKVTDVSGRGVGFNVVRQQVGKIGGQIRIETKKGHGTNMTLTIPLSLAIIGGLIVTIGNERYVIPTSNIRRSTIINKKQIQRVHGRSIIVYDGITIPLIWLDDILGIHQDKNATTNDDKVTVVVIERANKLVGLVVDSFEHKQEIVVLRLDTSGVFRSSFSNATILPDGSVSLILDPEILV